MSPEPAPLSKTAKYKKITKPLLERKRRARINRCLDELKDLMVGALEIDDDNLSKLEKADILELTVNHLTKLHRPKDPVLEAKKFQAGFGQCAAEACRFIMNIPELDAKVSQNLVGHLSRLITSQPLSIQVPERPSFSPPGSPSSVLSDRQHYYSDQERSSSDAEDSIYSENTSRHYARTKPGLLTTVDKVPHEVSRNYFNRVPVEAKDMILQKIRQHIMDKRGNDVVTDQHEQAPYEDRYRNDPIHPETYANDTLDLRKYRSPSKPEVTIPRVSPEIPERKPEPPPERELAMDYSNLPPKKKRKLIEYQEYKKQEEAKRIFEQKAERPPTEYQGVRQEEMRHKLYNQPREWERGFYYQQRGNSPPADEKWRPW
ncbi:protein hairy-like [Aricia agestis]|uniref:protein hairy-like n=1 Tax=Aricia agestis TaxID=91739 RepID=UPI001C2023AE|nr:protein hairy-like [Aricia agestis]